MTLAGAQTACGGATTASGRSRLEECVEDWPGDGENGEACDGEPGVDSVRLALLDVGGVDETLCSAALTRAGDAHAPVSLLSDCGCWCWCC